MHPGGVIEISGVSIQLDGHSGAPLSSAIKQMSSAVKCVSLYCRWRGSPWSLIRLWHQHLQQWQPLKHRKAVGETFWSGTQWNPATEQREPLVFSNEILSLEQHEGVWRALHSSSSSSSLSPGLQRCAQRLLGSICSLQQRLACSWLCVQYLKSTPGRFLQWPFKLWSLFFNSFFDKFSWQRHQHVLTPLLTLIKVV